MKASAFFSHHHSDNTTSHASMELNPSGETLLLRDRQHVRIEGAAGWTIRALGGTLWITQDGDIRDIVLEAGQSFTADRNSDVLMSPLGDARVCLALGAGCQSANRAAAAPSVMPVPARAAFA